MKTVLFILSCLMVLALVLVSCGPAAVEEEEGKTVVGKVTEEVEKEEKEEIAEVKEEKPTYGSMVTIAEAGTGSFAAPGVAGLGQEFIKDHLVYEGLAQPDWSRGPEGTNEIPFTSSFTPEEFHTSALAESWEIPDLKTYIFHLRKGVRFHNKPPAYGREMTADDVVWSLTKVTESPGAPFPTAEITATDKYTVHFEIPDADPNAFWTLMYRHFVYAPEMADSPDWKDACGTGPFMVEEVVPGSSATIVRNPDYWEYDPFNTENKLPYVDGVRELFMAESATKLAALRTGKIDQLRWIPWQQAESLQQTNPELLMKKAQGTTSRTVILRIDMEPFDDIKVRRALSLAIDNQAIVDDFYKGNADLISWPLQPDAIGFFTPFDELPDSQRELWEYHPEKARQLLADAGYPNGFQITAIIAPYPEYVDLMSIVTSYWEDIGVDVLIQTTEAGTFWSIVSARDYESGLFPYGNSNPYNFFNRFYRPPHRLNWFWKDTESFENSYINETRDKINSTVDADERREMIKELSLWCMDQVYNIPLPLDNNYIFWQPWVKGYSGEAGFGHVWSYHGFWKYVWIDQDLKYEMIGKR